MNLSGVILISSPLTTIEGGISQDLNIQKKNIETRNPYDHIIITQIPQ